MLSACDASSRRLSIFLCKPWIGAQCILQVVFLEVVVICTEITANFFLKPKFCGFVLSTGLFVLLLNDDFFLTPSLASTLIMAKRGEILKLFYMQCLSIY